MTPPSATKKVHLETYQVGNKSRLIQRDISLLEFNARVFAQAQDVTLPLLARVRFLTIFASNLDEFFMKRAQYHRQKGGRDAIQRQALRETLKKRVLELYQAAAQLYEKDLRPALKKNGIDLLDWKQLTRREKQEVRRYFEDQVYPVLTPLAVDLAHPFPFLSNLSHSLGIYIRNGREGESRFARVKIPEILPQWVQLTPKTLAGPRRYLQLRDIIAQNLQDLFPGMQIGGILAFRVTRHIDIELQQASAEELLDVVEEELRQRRMAQVVRLQVAENADPAMTAFLLDELEIESQDLYITPGEVHWGSLAEIASLDIPELQYKPWTPRMPARLTDITTSFFTHLRERDLLVHLPYDSFEASVERFIKQAVEDPQVLAIKIALYRIGENPVLVPLLIQAAEEGKQVVCVVELKARMDEARNIAVSEALEEVGVHVVYGLVGLKTHSKICLVVRREGRGGESFRFYGHIGTGNYNPQTARLYTDFGLFTARPDLTRDMLKIFNSLTGMAPQNDYRRFMVSPVNMREKCLKLIRAEVANARKKIPARIVAKFNSLQDPRMIEALYAASKAGVQIDLIVRGLCCLRAGVKGMSENIRVKSIVGRFLEHSRIYCFQAGAEHMEEGKFFIGSADWMERNLDHRVEALVPLLDARHRVRVWNLLEMYLEDKVQAWQARSDGSYDRPLEAGGVTPGVQERLMK